MSALLIGLIAASLAQPLPDLPLVGGYQKAAVKSPDVREAAAFAVRSAPQKVRLSRIISAQTQVVAGTNYRLCLAVKTQGAGYFGKGHLVQTVVYRDLRDHFSLTSWQPAVTCKP